MNTRRKYIFCGLLILLLVAAMIPVSCLLSLGEEDEGLSGEVISMYERYEAYRAMDEHMTVIDSTALDIEALWALEDMRTEAEGPLVSAMKNGDAPLGYDAASNTFYCTLGENNEEDWPQLNLRAYGQDNLRVAFVDDYTYDYCWDAISQGYRYEMIAYTDTEYAYIGVVFTGLPLVSLDPDCHFMEIGFDQDVGSLISISSAAHETVEGPALVHQRGGHFYRGIDKNSYRLEFHELNMFSGDDKRQVGVLGMEPDSDWLLVSSPADETAIRNQISWEIWKDWNRDGGLGINTLDSQLVELFIEDEYMGLYQLMQRIDVEKELVRMGGDLDTDMVARKIQPLNTGDRPVRYIETMYPWAAELRYLPARMSEEEAFGLMEDLAWMEVRDEGAGREHFLSDEDFTREVLAHYDIRHLMNYYLFFQSMSLAYDNVVNNVYIWTLFDGEGGYKHYLSPWDMDAGFIPIRTNPDGSDNDEINEWMYMPMRILALNIGNSREILWEIWNEKRATILEESALYQRIEDLEYRINASGAYLRETQRWRGEARELDLSDIKSSACAHQNTIESHMRTYWHVDDSQLQ
ncbi:MAG: CotH kinase family protein [Clostridia bacterium]|nr:CotH kinase family protein [Clostridia bacterium]